MYSPTLFISAVSGLIRLGSAARSLYHDRILKEDFNVVVEGFPVADMEQRRKNAMDAVFMARGEPDVAALLTSGDLAGFFTHECLQDPDSFMQLTGGNPHADNQIALIEDWFFDRCAAKAPGLANQIARDSTQDPRIRFMHREWLEQSDAPRGWGRFAWELVGVALDVVGAEPQLLGLDKKAESILRSMIPSFESLIDRRLLDEGGEESIGEGLVKTFVHAALSTVSENPSLVTSEERWGPVIQGVVLPLKTEVENNGLATFIAHKKLKSLVAGPVAFGALTAINENANKFLTGKFGADTVLGEVTRAVMSDSVTAEGAAGSYDLLKLFSQDGLLRIYDGAIKTAAKKPELFVRGVSDETSAARDFLRRLAQTMETSAPPPFDTGSGIGPEVISIAFDVAGEYADARIQAKAGDKDWDAAWADIYSNLMHDVLDGLKQGLVASDKTGGGIGENIFTRVFSREQAVDILKIISTHVASTPFMVTGERANPEVVNIARAVAEAVSSDEMGLLNADDWRSVISVMLGAAAKNPGVLFSIDVQDGLHHQLGLTLVQHVLQTAEASMGQAARQPGKILFGETLREALIATLQAANANIVNSIMSKGDTGARAHIEELGLFINKLNAFSMSGEAELAMSADEWLAAYKYFLAHVLEHGPGAVDKINRQHIVAFLRGESMSFADLQRLEEG